MVISQGEIYCVDFGTPKGSEPGYRRPCVIVQNDAFNASPQGRNSDLAHSAEFYPNHEVEYAAEPPLRYGSMKCGELRKEYVSASFEIDEIYCV